MVDIIVNCAAYTDVIKSEDNKSDSFNVNCEAVRNLSEVCKDKNIHIIHISTDYVFSGNKPIPLREVENTKPLNWYGLTKLNGENVLTMSKCNSTIIRTSWLYSKYGNNFVKTMLGLGREKNSVEVIYDQIGTPTYARDLAKTIVYMIKSGLDNGCNIYHYTNEGVTSWYDFCNVIFNLKGITCNVFPISTQQYKGGVKRPKFALMDKCKIKININLIYHIGIKV